jgi:hypothetical protein
MMDRFTQKKITKCLAAIRKAQRTLKGQESLLKFIHDFGYIPAEVADDINNLADLEGFAKLLNELQRTGRLKIESTSTLAEL